MKKFATVIILLLSFSFPLTSQISLEKKEMKPALLIIDTQNAFMPMMSKEDQERAIQMMNYSLMIFRQMNLPIIRIYHSSADYGVTPGEAGFEYPESLLVRQEDLKVIKTYPSSFVKTELDSLLKVKDINTLFLCGLSSVGCVLATYMDAFSYDYQAFMIKDAMLSHDAAYTNQIEAIFSALDMETVMYMLKVSVR